MTEKTDARLRHGICYRLKKIILSAAISGLILIVAGRAFADWYDYSWSYRKAITVTGSTSNQTNYQVKVTVSFVTSHMNSDFSDIRFTSSDGITLIDHWIESYTASTTADFWVEIPSIPAAGTTIYIYYGKSSATTASSLANTFIREINGTQPLIGSWHLDEGTGTTTADSSGNGYTGTLLPNGSEPTWMGGKFVNALLFNGSNYVSINDTANLDITGDITIEAWIYPTTTAYSGILAKRLGDGAANCNYDLYFTNTNSLGYYNGTDICNSVGQVSLYGWSHVAVTATGGAVTFYINGAPDSSTPSGAGIANAHPLLIGFDGAYSEYFHGIIDEVRLYNRALTAAEISDLYNYYGYATTDYPGRVLVRKYASPEPAPSTGSEEYCPPYLGGSYDGYDSIGTSDATIGYSTASKVVFTTSPSNSLEITAFPTQPVVTVQDVYGNTVATAANSVTLSMNNNPGGGTLSGTATLAAVAGVATFSGLSINREGLGYTLQAAASGLTSATSSSFNIIISTENLTGQVTTVQTQVTNVQTDVTSILQDTGTTLPASLSTIEGKIDTMSANVDAILMDTGTTLPGTLTSIEGKVNTIDTIVDSILVDTGTDLPAAITTAQNNVIDELAKGVKAKILNSPTAVETDNTATIRYKTDTGLSPTIDVYDAGNIKRVNAGVMLEIGTTGVYEYDVTFLSAWGAGDYTIVCSETTNSSIDSMTINVGTSIASVENKIDTLATDVTTAKNNVATILSQTGNIAAIKTKTDTIAWTDVTGIVTSTGAIQAKTDTIDWTNVTGIKTKTDTIAWTDVTGIKAKTDTILWTDVTAIKAKTDLITDMATLSGKIDTLTTNLNTIDTNIDSVNAIVGTTSDTSASSTLHGKLSGLASNVSAIVTKWGSYTADDLVGDSSDLGTYLGSPDDGASEDTVFGNLAAINANTGGTSTAATYAQNAYDEIQKVRSEISFNGKTDTAYTMLTGLKDTLSGLNERIGKIPSEVAAPGTNEIAASINDALSTLKEKAAQAGYPGIAEEAAKVEDKVKPAEGEPVDLNTLKNQLSELKALMDTIKASMTAEEEKPVVKSWFEMSK